MHRWASCSSSTRHLWHVHLPQRSNGKQERPGEDDSRGDGGDAQAQVLDWGESAFIQPVHQRDRMVADAEQAHSRDELGKEPEIAP